MTTAETILDAREIADVAVGNFSDESAIIAANDGLQEFVDETKILDTTEIFDVAEDDNSYPLQARAAYVERVWYDGKRITHRSMEELDKTVHGWKTLTGRPAHFFLDSSSRALILYPIPSEELDQGLEVREYLKPAKMSLSDPDAELEIAEQFHHAIAQYLAYRMLLKVGEPGAAREQRKEFEIAKVKARKWKRSAVVTARSRRIPAMAGQGRGNINLGGDFPVYPI